MTTQQLKDYKRLIEKEKSNAEQHYTNAKCKGRISSAEKHFTAIKAFDFCLKKIEDEILKISFNLSVSGQLLCSCGKPCKIPLCKECFEEEMKRQQKEQSNLR